MPDLASLARRHRRWLGAAAALALVALGFGALTRLTHELRFGQVRAAVHALSMTQIGLALALTAGSYLVLTLYDVLALRVIGRPLPWRTAALASFTSYTLSHNLGLALLTGGSARYRVYSAAGLDALDIARVVGVASATFWAGVVTVTGAALLTHQIPLTIAGRTMDPATLQVAGAAILMLAALLVVACGTARRPVSLLGTAVPLPRAGQAIAQVAIAVADIALASAALFVLIPAATPAMLPVFVLGYALAIVATVVTHVPGGLGVFEAVVMAVVPVDRTALFAALIAYRLIYYLLPLAVSLAILAWHEGVRRRVAFGLLVDARVVAVAVAPPVLAATTFLSGAMLLVSGSLPALKARIGALTSVLPLPFVEASHVAASLVGTALLLMSPFLYRRLDGAMVATRALLILGALFSLTKGVDYEEAAVCLAVAALLQWTRPAFYRRTALTGPIFSPATLASIGTVAGAAAWIGFFAERHVDYSADLWWRFSVQGDAPRFLRALLATTVLLAGVAVWRLMSPAAVRAEPAASAPDLDAIRPILAGADRTEAMLALTGDKRFLVSEAGDAFVMYQVRGASWIVMGDPVGPRAAWGDLLWRLRDLSDCAQGRLMLYEISPAAVALAIDLGLNIIKFGEEAIVDLPGFALDTPRLRAVRRSEKAAANKGATFRLVPADAVPVILPELAAVSDEWLRFRRSSEKGFSLGAFSPNYVGQFDIGIVTIDDRIVAFANLWLTANGREASVDLMRHREAAPAGTMDFLFANLIRWAAARGYRRFSLGMAPLSGIEGRRLAPAWAKAGAFVFRNGERLYGFKGLRTYKDKFAPDWEPRYIAGPQGIGLIQALRDLSRLIGKPRRTVERRFGSIPTARTACQDVALPLSCAEPA
ncbi:bifunctional lysylphosphatidylglycerol flippase/synthetase MprF [Sphingomonas sp.]|uniref:bifunctional lysylphosphatidylglycerol flippase/synthetase MprF n=1 Tax=Sphingomonas sp. TaxID=28214 RepID=UPI003B0044B9